VADLYEYAVSALGAPLHKERTRSSIRFVGSFDGSRKVVISLLPGDSSAEEGLRYQLYKYKFAELARIPTTDVESLMPQRHEDWSFAGSSNPTWGGFEGFITSCEEIDRLAGALSRVADSELTDS
jgi:hypothetical protein